MLDLSALDMESTTAPIREGEEVIQKIVLNKLVPGRYQPRTKFDEAPLTELAESIKAHGVMQPIIVRAINDSIYEIVAGERRWRASKIAGCNDIPVVVREISDSQALAHALVENLQREDLSPMEEAYALQRLKSEFGLKSKEVAEIVGKSTNEISRLFGLLKLPECLKMLYERGTTSPTIMAELSVCFKDDPDTTEKYVSNKDVITYKEAVAFKETLKVRIEKIPTSEFSGEGDGQKDEIEHTSRDEEIPTSEFSGNDSDVQNEGNEQPNDKKASLKAEQVDSGELTSWPKGKAIADPDRIKKPLLLIEYDGRAAAVLLNRRPSAEGRLFIRFEDGGGDLDVDGGECKFNRITDE